MEDGRFTLRMEQVDLQAEFEDAIFTYGELFRQEGIKLNYECGDCLLYTSLPGDLVVVHSQPTAQHGEIVVALIDDEATVKRLSLKSGQMCIRDRSKKPFVMGT